MESVKRFRQTPVGGPYDTPLISGIFYNRYVIDPTSLSIRHCSSYLTVIEVSTPMRTVKGINILAADTAYKTFNEESDTGKYLVWK